MSDYMKAMLYQFPGEIPAGIGLLPAAWSQYREKLSELAEKYPEFIGKRDESNYDSKPGSYAEGSFTDAWGCVWENISDGHESIVTGNPVPTRESVRTFKAPEVDAGLPHGFMYLRLLDLRRFEEFMIDIAEDAPEAQMLIDIVLEYNLRQTKIAIQNRSAGEVIYFGDDLGMQNALAMGPNKWRKYMKPCFKKIYSLCKEKDLYVYMHTDGWIWEIIPDLIDCGVNIINPQIRANGLDNLVRTCKGKVCINLDLDRQLFPFANPQEIDDHIRECVEALYMPEGGLMLSAECAEDVPLENIEAICKALRKYRQYKK